MGHKYSRFRTSVMQALTQSSILALLFLIFSGCSVVMATKQPDKKDLSVLEKGTPRNMVVAELGTPSLTEEKDGSKIDTFKFTQGYSTGSKTGRAFIHGVADVLTLGLWEVVGTPIEAIATGTDMTVVVTYDENDRVITVENLTDAKKKYAKAESSGEQLEKERQQLTYNPESRIITTRKQEVEEQKLAYIRESESITAVSLRTEPRKISDSYLRTTLPKYGFYDARLYPQGGSFENHFVDNGDGTITDRRTGLMWEKGGGSTSRTLRRAKFYVKKLNQNRFAGHSDWRLPTIEELASLLESHEMNGRHIDSLFDQKQARCWSSDKGPKFGGWTSTPPQAWYVNFPAGTIELQVVTPSDGEHSAFTSHIYVRAVRSLR